MTGSTSTSSRMNRVRIGRIIGTHGLGGAFKVLPLTDFPERFATMKRISVYGEDGSFLRELEIASARYLEGKKIVLLQAEQLRRIEDAEPLKGTFIEIPPEERIPLEEGEYWVDDLRGMTAVNHEDGEHLGTLIDVLRPGGADLYVIRDESGSDHYIPAVRQFIAEVNLEKRQVRISLVEGLWSF